MTDDLTLTADFHKGLTRGLPPDLYARCQNSLLNCHELDDNQVLRAVFVTSELSPFRAALPDASSKADRVSLCIGCLLPKRLSSGQPALPTFFETLSQNYPPGDALRDELIALAAETGEVLVRSPADTTSASHGGILPPLPHPYIVNPYGLPKHFIGRQRERQMLTEWLTRGQEPILVITALGGMGKSALAWVWLQVDVLGNTPAETLTPNGGASAMHQAAKAWHPQGVLWWSFSGEEAQFSVFLDQALIYAGVNYLSAKPPVSLHEKAVALVNLLQERRFLVILDGFERALAGFANQSAAYAGESVSENSQGSFRACAAPYAATFLKHFAALPGLSRILITSRLFPLELEDAAGCHQVDLAALDAADAYAFFRSHSIRGTVGEIQALCSACGYHPLSMRLLAGLIAKDPRTPGDVAATLHENPVLKIAPRMADVLELSYKALPMSLQRLLSRLAAFRSPVSYDVIEAVHGDSLAPVLPADPLRRMISVIHPTPRRMSVSLGSALLELVERGLVLCDAESAQYDLHPVIREYAYDRLTDKPDVHIRLRDYFTSRQPDLSARIMSIADVAPVMELFYHTVRAGFRDDAWDIYATRLRAPLYYQLGDYGYDIQLLHELLPDENGLPELKEPQAQTWVLLYLSMDYERIGQLRQALECSSRAVTLNRQVGTAADLGASLVASASVRRHLGQLQAARQEYQESIALFDRLGDPNWRGISHRNYAHLLIDCGDFAGAREQLDIAEQAYAERQGHFTHGLSILWRHRAEIWEREGELTAALDAVKQSAALAESGQYARELADANYEQGIIDLALGDIAAAKAGLQAALTHCRRTNLADLEPDVLLALARIGLIVEQGAVDRPHQDCVTLAHEALSIADRSRYRIKQATIHLFLAEVALSKNDMHAAHEHAEHAQERAWCDGPPNSYPIQYQQATDLLTKISQGRL